MASTWDGTFLTEPADGDSPSSGDDEIRVIRSAVTERMANEHTTYIADGTAGNYLLDWNHRAGSAKGYFQDAAPTNRPNAATALTAADNGRLWFDDNNGDILYVYVHPNWVGVVREIARFSIQGEMATGQKVIPSIVFPRGCTVLRVDAYLDTAPTGAAFRLDLEAIAQGAGSSIFDTNDYVEIAIAANTGNSTDMEGTNSVIAAGERLEIDIDQVGSTIPGSDLSITIEVLVG